VSGSFSVVEGDGPIVATAIHDGHELRLDCSTAMLLDEATRLREEDPFTRRIAAVVPTHFVVTRSRFEVDLNRPRDKAVYRCAADAWNLDVWSSPPDDELVKRSLAQYDDFYAAVERVLRDRERRYGRFVVLDIHSYNHRRGGASGDVADAARNPEINVGTGSLDRKRWGGLVDRFCRELHGGELSKWVHRTFPKTGCCLAIEFKKTFMNEWTGELDAAHLDGLARAIASTLPALIESLRA
jgi:N-formylglutamate deformylase